MIPVYNKLIDLGVKPHVPPMADRSWKYWRFFAAIFFFKCRCQLSLSSKWSPRYFVDRERLSEIPFICRELGGKVYLRLFVREGIGQSILTAAYLLSATAPNNLS